MAKITRYYEVPKGNDLIRFDIAYALINPPTNTSPKVLNIKMAKKEEVLKTLRPHILSTNKGPRLSPLIKIIDIVCHQFGELGQKPRESVALYDNVGPDARPDCLNSYVAKMFEIPGSTEITPGPPRTATNPRGIILPQPYDEWGPHHPSSRGISAG